MPPHWIRATLRLLALLATLTATDARAGEEVRVMTYNIRYDEPRDGRDAWTHRRARVAAVIRDAAPDVLGVQEALAHQVEHLRLDLERYGVVSAGRDPGDQGERCAVFYDRERFSVAASGTFWLSPTPEAPSKGWDAALNRIATWVQLVERAGGRTLLVVNTHFDHRGEVARRESAALVAQRLQELAAGAPAVLIGDFNFEPGSAGYVALDAALDDAATNSETPATGPHATFTGFGDPTQVTAGTRLPRIDHVFVPAGVRVLAHTVLAERATDTSYASDHRPVLATLAPWPAAPEPPPAEPAPRRPNIVFVFSDDHAAHAIGAYARDPEMPFGQWLAPVDPTPRIDALAAEGMRFRRSFCTNGICGPSRAVILTGKHSHVNGFRTNGDEFDGAQPTFPKLLQAAGYRTAVIGKWHLTSDPQGFDHWEVLPGQGDYYNPVLIGAGGRRRIEGHCTDVVTDLALEWLEAQKEAQQASDQPFLLMCQHKAPHRTWMPALRHLELYDGVTLPEPPTLFDDYASIAPAARFQEMTIARDMNLVYDLFVTPGADFDPEAGTALDRSGFQNLARLTPEQRTAWDAYFEPRNAAFRAAELTGEARVRWMHQRYLANYLRCVRGVDESVGRILDWLDAAGLAENTVVVYASDQGFFLGDHGWYDKRWMYEESLTMPLIVRWPGATAPGSVDGHLVQNLDYAPTFLELAGVTPPADMQGRSLVPLLRGEDPEGWRESIYYHYYEYPASHMVAPHHGVRTERWKLVHYYPFDEWELFDLAQDPDERTNLFGLPEHAATAAHLARELGRLQAEYGDTTVTGAWSPERRAEVRRERAEGEEPR